MGNVEVYVEGSMLDVLSGMEFSFNYQVSDIRQPDTRSTEFSKTIRCPGTAANNILFGNVFDVNIANPSVGGLPIGINFNPNKKASVTVMVDTAPVFDGIIQLRKVLILGDRIDYEVVMIGRLSNLFSKIADYKLSGNFITNEANVVAGATPIYAPYIDYSDLDHQYSRANIIASWSTPMGQGYVYPMIDFGTNMNYYNDGRRVYHVEDHRPAIYLKDLIDRIFAYAGCTYESSLIEGAGFAHLIVPLTKMPTMSDWEFDRHKILVGKQEPQALHNRQLLTTGQPFSFGNHSGFLTNGTLVIPAKVCYEIETIDPINDWRILDTPTQVVNGGSNFNPAGGQYEMQIYQDHRRDSYIATVDLRLWYNRNNNGMVAPNGIYKQSLQIIHYRAANATLTVVGETEFEWDMAAIFAVSSVGTGPFPAFLKTVRTEANNIDTFLGDVIYVQIDASDPIDGFGSDYALPVASNTLSYVGYQIEGGGFECIPNRMNLFEGGQYDINTHLPDVSMRDLLVSVFRMFNLQLTPSKDREDHYIIETWSEFYNGGTMRDWTYKLDHASPVELIPMGLLAAREYMFGYSPDGDYYNDRYQSTHGRTYGSRRFEVDNDFVPKRTETTVVFSATPLCNDHGSNRLIPKIYDVDVSEGAKPTDANIRVLYYAGLLPSTPSWRFRSGYPPAVNLDQTQNYYPYAGHLDHPITPTFDLSWGIPFELYYSTNLYIALLFYTNANLFNLYHLRQYREIIDKDSKLMVAYFYLSPLDILKLDFRDTIAIDGCFWRLNRVMDFNPFKEGLTKVELVKVIQLDPFKKSDIVIGSGGRTPTGSSLAEMEMPPFSPDSIKQRNSNDAPTFQGTVKGSSNIIHGSATAFNVSGDRNTINAGSSNITIVGNQNVVDGGLQNVTILNSTGYHATKSNLTVINGGELVIFGDTIEGGLDEVRSLKSATPVTIIDGGLDTVTNLYATYHNDIN